MGNSRWARTLPTSVGCGWHGWRGKRRRRPRTSTWLRRPMVTRRINASGSRMRSNGARRRGRSNCAARHRRIRMHRTSIGPTRCCRTCRISQRASVAKKTRKWSAPRLAAFGDEETGVESALTEVHIEAFLDEVAGLSEVARLGLDLGFLLQRELKSSRISGPFRIIISAQLADPDLKVGNTCTVRFHKQRTGQVWLDDDLEEYREEAIAVL